MIGIYKIENIITDKKYLGSSLNIEKRILRHKNELTKNKHVNTHLQREFNKYGVNFFIFEIVEICNKEEVREIEQKYLDLIFSDERYYKYYYNIGKLSSGGDNISFNPNRDLIIQKIKNGLKLRYSLETIDEKSKRCDKLLGENNPNFGNKWSDEQKEKMSNYRKGIPSKIKGKTFNEIHGEEVALKLKEKMSSSMKGKLIGEKNGFYGKKHSKENLIFFSESQRSKPNKGFVEKLKPFIIDDIIYLTLNEASKKLDINYLTIRNRLLSNRFINYIYITDINIIDKLKEEYLNKDKLDT